MTSFQDYFGSSNDAEEGGALVLSSREESLITSLQSVGSVFGAVI